MKAICILLIILASSSASSVGFRYVSTKNIDEFGISIDVRFSADRECYDVSLNLPAEREFGELGARKLVNLDYVKVDGSKENTPLLSKGTRINLSANGNGSIKKIRPLCLSSGDIESSYLVAVYGESHGAVPIVLFIKLNAFI